MARMEPLSVAANQLESLTELLRNNFQIKDQVETVYCLREGGCAAQHMVVKVTNGDMYGLKSSTRVINALDKELLMSDLAMLLEAPNASKTIQLPGLIFGIFNGVIVNITKWLSESRNFTEFNEVSRNELQDNSDAFFQQYGEWISFSLCFGVADRHAGNWVWNTAKKQLLMIDLEDSFSPSGLFVNSFDWARDFASKEPAKFLSDPYTFKDSQCLLDGLKKMIDKLQQRAAQVQNLLNRHDFSKNFKSPYFSTSGETVFKELIGLN